MKKANSNARFYVMDWPDLDSVSHVCGRIATSENGVSGSAVFVLEGGDKSVDHHPLHIVIPLYAFFRDESEEPVPCVVKQAERVGGIEFYGIWQFDGDQCFVASPDSLELLGTETTCKDKVDDDYGHDEMTGLKE